MVSTHNQSSDELYYCLTFGSQICDIMTLGLMFLNGLSPTNKHLYRYIRMHMWSPNLNHNRINQQLVMRFLKPRNLWFCTFLLTTCLIWYMGVFWIMPLSYLTFWLFWSVLSLFKIHWRWIKWLFFIHQKILYLSFVLGILMSLYLGTFYFRFVLTISSDEQTMYFITSSCINYMVYIMSQPLLRTHTFIIFLCMTMLPGHMGPGLMK